MKNKIEHLTRGRGCTLAEPRGSPRSPPPSVWARRSHEARRTVAQGGGARITAVSDLAARRRTPRVGPCAHLTATHPQGQLLGRRAARSPPPSVWARRSHETQCTVAPGGGASTAAVAAPGRAPSGRSPASARRAVLLNSTTRTAKVAVQIHRLLVRRRRRRRPAAAPEPPPGPRWPTRPPRRHVAAPQPRRRRCEQPLDDDARAGKDRRPLPAPAAHVLGAGRCIRSGSVRATCDVRARRPAALRRPRFRAAQPDPRSNARCREATGTDASGRTARTRAAPGTREC